LLPQGGFQGIDILGDNLPDAARIGTEILVDKFYRGFPRSRAKGRQDDVP
jgi:hypothetical protein